MNSKRDALDERGDLPLSRKIPVVLGIRVPFDGIEYMKQRKRR